MDYFQPPATPICTIGAFPRELEQDFDSMDWSPAREVVLSMSPSSRVKRSFDELSDTLPVEDRPIKRARHVAKIARTRATPGARKTAQLSKAVGAGPFAGVAAAYRKVSAYVFGNPGATTLETNMAEPAVNPPSDDATAARAEPLNAMPQASEERAFESRQAMAPFEHPDASTRQSTIAKPKMDAPFEDITFDRADFRNVMPQAFENFEESAVEPRQVMTPSTPRMAHLSTDSVSRPRALTMDDFPAFAKRSVPEMAQGIATFIRQYSNGEIAPTPARDAVLAMPGAFLSDDELAAHPRNRFAAWERAAGDRSRQHELVGDDLITAARPRSAPDHRAPADHTRPRELANEQRASIDSPHHDDLTAPRSISELRTPVDSVQHHDLAGDGRAHSQMRTFIDRLRQHDVAADEHPHSPSESLQSPNEHLQSPSEHFQSPSEHLQSPSEHLQSPAEAIEHLQSSTQHSQSPSSAFESTTSNRYSIRWNLERSRQRNRMEEERYAATLSSEQKAVRETARNRLQYMFLDKLAGARRRSWEARIVNDPVEHHVKDVFADHRPLDVPLYRSFGWSTPKKANSRSTIDSSVDVDMEDYRGPVHARAHFVEEGRGFGSTAIYPSRVRLFDKNEPFENGKDTTPIYKARSSAMKVAAVDETPDQATPPSRFSNHPANDTPTQLHSPPEDLSQLIEDVAKLNPSKEHSDATRRSGKTRSFLSQLADLAAGKAYRREQERKKLEADRLRIELEEKRKEEEAARAAERERKKKLLVVKPLSNDWEARVDEAMAYRNMQKEITPTILRKDLGTLLPQTSVEGRGLLNDEIVTNYLTLLSQHVADKDPNQKYHAFNSHMYSTYQRNGNSVASLRRWMKRAKLDGDALLKGRRIFIPINDHLHWTLLSISGTERTIRYYDSLGGTGRPYTRFALILVKDTLGDMFNPDEWSVEVDESAMQTNGLDCGAFVCLNALAVTRGIRPPDGVDTTWIPSGRRQIAATLINRGFSGDFDFDLP